MGENQGLREEILKLGSWLVTWRRNPGLEAPAVEQELLSVALWLWLRVGGAGRCSSLFSLDTWAILCSVLDSTCSSMPCMLPSGKELLQKGTSKVWV